MTTRFPRRLAPVREEEGVVDWQVPRDRVRNANISVTAETVDQAVEDVFETHNVDAATRDVMRKLMSSDVNTGVAHAYYNGLAASGMQKAFEAANRKALRIPYVLADKQMVLLNQYAPEYQLTFRHQENHDHPAGAACRVVDRSLVASRVPPGVASIDLGGAPYVHVQAGTLGAGVHVCSPIADAKDPARAVYVRRRVLKLLASPEEVSGAHEAARAYLAKSVNAICDKRAQECDHQARVITSVHVYDVPMADWPGIMGRHGARLVEGCLLFPAEIFSRSSGEMETAGARYEADANANVFRMGFVGSPAWWYEHSLIEYLKYGVDQLMVTENGTYSYKVVERRGDTLFFRILRVADNAAPLGRQVFRLPGVPCVRVRGYALERSGRALARSARRDYLWPLPLWEEMMAHAALMVERNTLSPERLMNYYRSIAPRQTINSVHVMGGYTVSQAELVALVVHVTLAAAAAVMKTQAESKAVIARDMRTRGRQAESTVYKALAAFGAGLLAMGHALILPLALIKKFVDDGTIEVSNARLVDWEPECAIQEVNAKVILARHYAELDDVDGGSGFADAFLAAAPMNPIFAAKKDKGLAEVLVRTCGDVLGPDMVKQLQGLADSAQSVDDGQSTTVVAASDDARALAALERLEAVKEAIVEVDMENLKVTASCASAYRDLVSQGKPAIRSVKTRAEEFMNPDFWFLRNGVVESSLLGVEAGDFAHAAVYVDVADSSGARLRPVFTERFSGMSEGREVSREYVRIAGDFTGWAFVNDSLMIYNGPEIRASLVKALECPMDFEVVLHQGPAGCGKTTSVVREARLEDVISCPVRLSCQDTAARLVQEKPEFAAVVKSRVRTLDSYLVNYGTSKAVRELAAPRLLADELFMARAGKWYAMAALLGVRKLVGYGDQEQIPHVPRAECPKQYVVVKPSQVEESFLTYRCPPALLACFGEAYGWRVRSASKEVGSVRMVASTAGMTIPSGCVMMAMYQSEKKMLRQMYARCGVKVEFTTTHEAQGKTYKHVWLHRFDNRKRTDNFSLYDKPRYVLVAMSRCTHSFVYVAPSLDDQVEKWIKKGADPRRVEAARDVQSAGEVKEFA